MPGNKHPGPSAAEWRVLYDAAQAYRAAAPWTDLTDEDLFAVELPGSSELVYCSVMGAGGVEYGLAAYPGARALASYLLLFNSELDEDEVLLSQHALAFTLADRDDMETADRAVHAALGLRFRGKGAWPFFRRHQPNLLPGQLATGEAQLLAICLDQARALAAEVRAGIAPIDADPRRIPVRRLDAAGNWQTGVVSLPVLDLEHAFDAERAARLSQRLRQEPMQWEVRLMALVPLAGEQGEPAFWGRVLLCVDHASGFVFHAGVLGPEDGVPDAFLDIVENSGFVPSGLRLTSSLLEEQLSPIAERLGIRMRRVSQLPMLEEAATGLGRAFH